jgi:hypothetical protein
MRTRQVSCFIAVLALGGALARPSRAAFGDPLFANCNAQQQAYLRDVLELGKIAASSAAFAECIDQKLVRYAGCDGIDLNGAPARDPEPMFSASHAVRVQAVLAAVRSPNDVMSRCDGGCPPGATACSYSGSYGHAAEETYRWNPAPLAAELAELTSALPDCADEASRFVSSGSQVHSSSCLDPVEPFSTSASTIWHELMHTQGFLHPENNGSVDCGPRLPGADAFGYVPWIVGECMEKVLWMSSYRCSASACGSGGAGIWLTDGFDSASCECVEARCFDDFRDPADPTRLLHDRDADGSPDACDAFPDDADNDGLVGARDNCPMRTNLDQLDRDRDGLGDVCDNCALVSNVQQTDADSDRFGDACDNCPVHYNPDQLNQDRDAFGNTCDADVDGDGRDNGIDNCPYTANSDQKDADGDGIGDPCDSCDLVRDPSGRTCDPNWLEKEYQMIMDHRIEALAQMLSSLRIGGPWGSWERVVRIPGMRDYRVNHSLGFRDVGRYLADRRTRGVTAADVEAMLGMDSRIGTRRAGDYVDRLEERLGMSLLMPKFPK